MLNPVLQIKKSTHVSFIEMSYFYETAQLSLLSYKQVEIPA